MKKYITSVSILFFLLSGFVLKAQKASRTKNIYAKQNLIAWCIVPYDVKNRGPVERAEMLNKLGFTMLAYDWREKHIPEFDAELDALKKHHIKLQAFWYHTGANPESDKNLPIILDVLKRHGVKTQIWLMVSGIKDLDKMSQQEKLLAIAKPVNYVAEKAAEIGCTVGLYNHGGWYGMPENQLEVIRYLKKPNIGIVYNFHHAEEDIERFPKFFPEILPHLFAVNLMGLKKGNPVKVVPIGEGDAESEMIKIVRENAYNGPIGIINEDTAPDAEVGLTMNMHGLKKILKEQSDQAALNTYK
ncbi:sugar phosphate isomerase/epimerase [Dyadobacter sp. CY345]|uniref:sugar phosphate isomerase/epimerase family protein n=1 Tax=Dyadobacter sp. CY345 TaxID=2909335 RepID=UPI001F32FB63|nr:TIM barrel protein [Dyadobacter sp. CY345]MCF2443481.1 sugar phosphate isomerase/epimerase [Dyadobacter sp. CY345]